MWKPPILKLVAPRAYAGAAIESKGTDATAPTAEMITNMAKIVVAFMLQCLSNIEYNNYW